MAKKTAGGVPLLSKTNIELEHDLKTHQDRLWTLKNDLAAGKVKNVKEIKKIKKDIARILTVFRMNRKDTAQPRHE